MPRAPLSSVPPDSQSTRLSCRPGSLSQFFRIAFRLGFLRLIWRVPSKGSASFAAVQISIALGTTFLLKQPTIQALRLCKLLHISCGYRHIHSARIPLWRDKGCVLLIMAIPLPSSSAKVWLFYIKRSSGLRGSLNSNTCREICSYFVDFSRELVRVTYTFLRFFNCYTSTWERKVGKESEEKFRHRDLQVIKKESVWLKYDCSSTWILLDDERVFCSGGGNC